MVAAVALLHPATLMADRAEDEFNAGVVLWRKDRFTPAVEAFEKFLEDYPDHSRAALAHFYLGLSYSSLRKYADSRNHFEQFLQLDPQGANTAAAKYRVGECSYYLKEYDKAVDQLQDYTAQYPEDKLIDWGNLQLGESLVQVKRWEDADRILTALAAESENDYIRKQAEYTLALSLERQTRFDDAVKAYRKVAEQDDARQATRALARAGTIRFRQQQYEQASDLYDQIVSDFATSRLMPAAALNSGLSQYRLKNYEQALQRFRQVPETSAERIEATLLSGMSLARLERVDEARKTLRAAYEAAGKTGFAAEALFEMARLEQIAEDYPLATQMYQDLIDRWPEDSHVADAIFNAASLQLETDHPADAEKLLSRLNSDFPDEAARPRARFLAGRVLLQQDRKSDAREAFSQVAESDQSEERSVALSLYYIAKVDHEARQFESALKMVQRLRPLLEQEANDDLHGALALGAMSALELDRFDVTEELASAYLQNEEHTSQSADALAARTVARASTGKYGDAVQDADALVKSSPENPQTWTAILQSAEAAWDKNEYDAARQLFQRAENEQAPIVSRRSGASGVAWAFFRLQQFQDAAEAFQQIANNWPKSTAGLEGRYMAARSLQEAGQLETAVTSYIGVSKDFAELAPSAKAPALQQRLRNYALDAGRTAARLLAGEGRDEESNQQWADLVDRFQDTKDLDVLLDEWALQNLKAKNYDKADEIYRRLLKDRPDSRFAGTARLSLAESTLNEGQMDKAMAEFEAIIDHEQYDRTDKARAMYHLTDIYTERQNWARVEELSKRFAVEHSGESLAPRIQLLRADALLALDQLDEARDLLEMLRQGVLDGQLEKAPWTERIWIVLGEVALAAEDYESVDPVAAEFSEQFPQSRLQFQMTYVQGRRWKNQAEPDFEKARVFFDETIYDDTGRGTRTAARCQFLIADTRLMQKDYAQASRDYFKVYTLYRYPDLQAQALFQAGACQQKLGNTQEAIANWKSLIEEFPESPLAKDAADLLENPPSDPPQT